MGVLGIDIGGTQLRVGLVEDGRLARVEAAGIRKDGSAEEIVQDLVSMIGRFAKERVEGIGIGVPSVVDAEEGIVYDVQNIPSWKEVHLREILEARFNIPVYVNNDANCFAVGEKYFGKAEGYRNIVGLIIGTGLGAGLILNDRLYAGNNSGAGEFGMIPYGEHTYEHYCSGQFFQNEYGVSGEEAFRRAESGDERALEIFARFGAHLGDAITMILFAVDPEAIVLGGSVSTSFRYFNDAMWHTVKKFPYQHSLQKLKIMTSDREHIAILGAAALYYESRK